MVLHFAVQGPQPGPVVIEERIADGELVLAVAINVVGIGIMARVAGGVPHHLQTVIQGPKVVVAGLQDDVRRTARAAQVAEVERVAQNAWKLVVGRFRARRHARSRYLVLGLARGAVRHDQLHIHAVDHFRTAVAVNVVDLEGHVVGQTVLPPIRLADPPEDLPVERHRGQATQFAVGVLRPVVDHLADQDLDLAVVVEVAETQVAADAEALRCSPSSTARDGDLPPPTRPTPAPAPATRFRNRSFSSGVVVTATFL